MTLKDTSHPWCPEEVSSAENICFLKGFPSPPTLTCLTLCSASTCCCLTGFSSVHVQSALTKSPDNTAVQNPVAVHVCWATMWAFMPCLTPYYHTVYVVGVIICIRITYVMLLPFLLGNESLLALLLCIKRTCTQWELEFYWWKIETQIFQLENLKFSIWKHRCNVSGKL